MVLETVHLSLLPLIQVTVLSLLDINPFHDLSVVLFSYFQQGLRPLSLLFDYVDSLLLLYDLLKRLVFIKLTIVFCLNLIEDVLPHSVFIFSEWLSCRCIITQFSLEFYVLKLRLLRVKFGLYSINALRISFHLVKIVHGLLLFEHDAVAFHLMLLLHCVQLDPHLFDRGVIYLRHLLVHFIVVDGITISFHDGLKKGILFVNLVLEQFDLSLALCHLFLN